MYTKPILFLILILALFSACETEDFTPEDAQAAEVAENKTHAMSQLLNLVNQLRSKGCDCGSNHMPPVARLNWNSDLDDAALRHAYDMDTNNFFDHTGSDGTDVSKRVSDTGYTWQAVGENIAWGYQDIQSVFLGWKDSPGHCRNMMSVHFQHMGGARVGKYWVQTFARPRSN